MYFQDKVSEVAFYLVELDGKCRLDKLNVKPNMYSSKKAADKWENNLLIVLENSTHEMKNEAIEELEKIYQGMI